MSTGIIIGIILAVIVIVIGAAVLAVLAVSRRHRLQQRFGPEYDRVVAIQPLIQEQLIDAPAVMAAISSRAVSAGVSYRVLGPRSFSVELAAGLDGDRARTLVVPVRQHRHSPLGDWRCEEGGTGELRTALLQRPRDFPWGLAVPR
jgi:hypothetical protein